MTDLYYIANYGCDDTTIGLAIIPEVMFVAFKQIIEDLNKNSNCSCMPTIEVYKIDEGMIREATDNDNPDYVMHLGEARYIAKKGCCLPYDFLRERRVI